MGSNPTTEFKIKTDKYKYLSNVNYFYDFFTPLMETFLKGLNSVKIHYF